MLTITAISMAYKALTPIYNGIIIIMRQSAPPIFVTIRNKILNTTMTNDIMQRITISAFGYNTKDINIKSIGIIKVR